MAICKVVILLCHLVPYGLTACTNKLEHMQDTEDISNTGRKDTPTCKIFCPTLAIIDYLKGMCFNYMVHINIM